MYITKEQLKERLSKTELLVIERKRKERGEEKRLSHEDRVMIGVLENIDIGNKKATQKEIAELVGVSAQTVSNNSRGLTSPTIGVDKELKEDVENKIEKIGNEKIDQDKKIQEQLVTNLAAALGQVANNLSGTDAVEASKIATDMSKILDRVVSSKDGGHRGSRTAIIINVPSMKEEKAYQTIEV